MTAGVGAVVALLVLAIIGALVAAAVTRPAYQQARRYPAQHRPVRPAGRPHPATPRAVAMADLSALGAEGEPT